MGDSKMPNNLIKIDWLIARDFSTLLSADKMRKTDD
jgi:hypothetical protein